MDRKDKKSAQDRSFPKRQLLPGLVRVQGRSGGRKGEKLDAVEVRPLDFQEALQGVAGSIADVQPDPDNHGRIGKIRHFGLGGSEPLRVREHLARPERLPPFHEDSHLRSWPAAQIRPAGLGINHWFFRLQDGGRQEMLKANEHQHGKFAIPDPHSNPPFRADGLCASKIRTRGRLLGPFLSMRPGCRVRSELVRVREELPRNALHSRLHPGAGVGAVAGCQAPDDR